LATKGSEHDSADANLVKVAETENTVILWTFIFEDRKRSVDLKEHPDRIADQWKDEGSSPEPPRALPRRLAR
jgi:hypothetical protein